MVSPFRRDPAAENNIWCNLINHWSKHDCIEYIEGNPIPRSPVSKVLCRSGECLCGSMQDEGDRKEASYFYPSWGEWLDALEAAVLEKFPWKWGQPISKTKILEMHGQQSLFSDFQPMCTGCKINFKRD